MSKLPDRRILGAGALFAAATVVFATALARALTVEPVEITPSAPAGPVATAPEVPAEASSPSERMLDADAIRLAVDHDPFQPDRRRPEPYRMPGEQEEAAPPRVELPPPPPFQLLGTITIDDGGLALIRVEESPPRTVAVGESLLGYKLEQVQGKSAMLTGQGRTVFLTVADAAPQPPPPARAQRGRGNRNTNAREGAAEALRERVLQQRAVEQLERAVEQLRERGAPEEVIENVMRQLEQARRGSDQGWTTFFRDGLNSIVRGMRVLRDTSDVPDPRLPREQ